MIISGNQTAIAEYMNLLDKDFVPPFYCKCGCDNIHTLYCHYQSKDYETRYGCNYFIYDIDYNGYNISSAKLLHQGYANGNLIDGCVK